MFKRKKTRNKLVKNFYQNKTIVRRKKSKKISRKLLNWKNEKTIKKIVIVSFVVFLGFLIWLIFFTQFLKIEKIDISKTKHIPSIKIEKMIWEQVNTKKFFIFPQNIIIFFDKNELIKKLKNNFQLRTIKISKKLPNQLVVKIAEKEYTLIWNEGGQFHYINNQGDIILTLDKPEKNQIVIYNQGSSLLQGRQIKISPKMITFINNLNDEINAKHIIKIKEFIVDNDLNTIKLKEEGGPLIFFNINNEVDKQIIKLKTLLTTLQDTYKQLHYIDLRFGDRIFYQ